MRMNIDATHNITTNNTPNGIFRLRLLTTAVAALSLMLTVEGRGSHVSTASCSSSYTTTPHIPPHLLLRRTIDRRRYKSWRKKMRPSCPMYRFLNRRRFR